MIHHGNLTIDTAADVAKYAGITAVTGDLYIRADAFLPVLTTVGGNVEADSYAGLPALKTIGGNAYLYAGSHLPELTTIGGMYHAVKV